MTKNEMIRRLMDMDDDKVLVVNIGDGGWANVDEIIETESNIEIHPEKYPIFYDED